MLDIKFIRENLELCKTAAVNKNRVVDWDTLLKLDDVRRALIGKSEVLRTQRNKASGIGADDKAREAGKKLKEELKSVEDELRSVELEFTAVMLTVPNVPDKSVPVGKDETGNVEIKKMGYAAGV